jgi:hypothetical protein
VDSVDLRIVALGPHLSPEFGNTAKGSRRTPEADKASLPRSIENAKTAASRQSLVGVVNPHGKGRASEKIVEVLTTVPLTQDLLVKRPDPPIGASMGRAGAAEGATGS